MRDGSLGLSHFKLLKRLGCGDIGSVYLAELRGSHSHFAMKVRLRLIDTTVCLSSLPSSPCVFACKCVCFFLSEVSVVKSFVKSHFL